MANVSTTFKTKGIVEGKLTGGSVEKVRCYHNACTSTLVMVLEGATV